MYCCIRYPPQFFLSEKEKAPGLPELLPFRERKSSFLLLTLLTRLATAYIHTAYFTFTRLHLMYCLQSVGYEDDDDDDDDVITVTVRYVPVYVHVYVYVYISKKARNTIVGTYLYPYLYIVSPFSMQIIFPIRYDTIRKQNVLRM